jgi:phosphoglycolate phosphatase
VRELMRHAGHGDAHIDAQMDRLIALYLDNLRVELTRPDKRAYMLPGVPALLDALEQRDDVILGLLTGNVEPGARAKLAAVGIDFERFRVGAFGSDHEHRPELPAIARARAKGELGVDVTGEAIVVIGDTPADLTCGRSLGASAIGVATGRYSVAQLLEHDPVAAFEDLSDTSAVLSAILDR